mmetsp:Transcript_18040/g.30850  ORF Transcript_18040/g.30850 Transcript_18040/m.30850 type:complete len:378 (-) Transcript_18040:308-1441(-)|eukprot:CAMPEP_0119102156 /NCGR_PEP_ID=MMETSP1180-20130426/1006_1 /TAXON_ID=3052 ORGANISM="Chlamydomonas cf sp, Strain CCMP681" /NCGR_SAMPLE_ID=MMETSP1180 /ASSEMBLY_ACC=CAM_ASM_000741 /LENGTH=377 /DNA_ID=CAMNT_0007086399 /DNA_START=122 /DNA_END=1255 /DNA_ORIENTATION=+
MASQVAPSPSPSKIWSSITPAPKGHVLLLLITFAPLVVNVPANLSVILHAAITVYCGCWRSVKPEPPTESMTKQDAMRFPLVGSAVLFTLFLAFKFLPKDLINYVLNGYLGVLAVFVLTVTLVPYVESVLPEKLLTPRVRMPAIKVPYLFDWTQDQPELSLADVAVGLVSSGFCGWYMAKRHWLANNILGIAFSIEGIEHLSLGSLQVGVILLSGLFVYDIFWVFNNFFGESVMVAVAKSFEAPIKLLFPRGMDLAAAAVVGEPGKRLFSMLGLGDIVIPGIFVALLLRYDVHRNFTTSYFQTAFVGYVMGLVTTIVVMNVFNAAQPALLYIVPSVLGAVLLHAWVKGELLEVWNYSEAPEAIEAEKAEETETKKVK